tara:strand:+ start:185 stop:304 length:120 start_codon:yes stop_codon:yes gene_type:complete
MKYDGDLKDGKRHGQGTFIFATGHFESGIYKNGKFDEVN